MISFIIVLDRGKQKSSESLKLNWVVTEWVELSIKVDCGISVVCLFELLTWR